jgi:hypothetical protein
MKGKSDTGRVGLSTANIASILTVLTFSLHFIPWDHGKDKVVPVHIMKAYGTAEI